MSVAHSKHRTCGNVAQAFLPVFRFFHTFSVSGAVGQASACLGSFYISVGDERCLSGVRLLACRRDPARRRARVLPEGTVPAQNPVGLVGGKALQRSEPLLGGHGRTHQQVDVIGHHHKGMQLIALEAELAILQGLDHHTGDFGPPQKKRTASGLVQEAVQDKEGSAGGHAGGGKDPLGGKTSVQAEGDKQAGFSGILRESAALIQPAGPKPGRSTEVLPHPDSTHTLLLLKCRKSRGRPMACRVEECKPCLPAVVY